MQKELALRASRYFCLPWPLHREFSFIFTFTPSVQGISGSKWTLSKPKFSDRETDRQGHSLAKSKVSLIHYLPSAMFLNLKVPREGTVSNAFSTVCKSSNSRPSFVLFLPAFKSCLRGIYTAGIVRAFEFPICIFNLVSMPESITYRERGFSEASPHSSPDREGYFSCSFVSRILLLWSPTLAACCSRTAGRDGKRSMHSLGKRN